MLDRGEDSKKSKNIRKTRGRIKIGAREVRRK